MTGVPPLYDYINSIDCESSLFNKVTLKICTLRPTSPETELVMSSAPNISYLFTR